MSAIFPLDLSLNRLYQHSGTPRPKLRVGVMVDGPRMSRFARQVVLDIRESDFAELAFVIENVGAPSPAAQRPAAWKRILRTFTDQERRRHLLYRVYLRWIDARYRIEPDPIERVDCTDLLSDVPRIAVAPIRTRFVDRFPDDAIAAIRERDLDVICRFGFRIIRGPILDTARHGVWSFHHDDSSRYRGGPPQLWELIEDNPLTGAVLQRLSDALDAGAVLGEVNLCCARVPSVSVNRFNVYWSAQHLVIRTLHDLHRFGPERLRPALSGPRPYEGRKPVYRTPNNAEMGRWLAPRILRGAVRKLSRRPGVTHWRIAVRRSKEPLHREARPDLTRFTWIESPRGRFWADPFLLPRGDTMWTFFEDYDYEKQKANVACARLADDGRLLDVRTALDRPYHMSYPHVFESEGETWMVPESCHSGAVELYRCVRFPDEWVLDRRLVELRAVDPTVFEHDGRWWMFVSPSALRTQAHLTLLFMAPRLQGPWELHPASPICSHVRWSRNAGRVFADGPQLVRPSQDCSNGYGYSVCFNRITRLSETEYAEERGRTILPDAMPGLAGFHTYNRSGDWEIVDGRFAIHRRDARPPRR